MDPVPSQRIAPGTTLGRYVVQEPLGSGAMGVVYAAHDRGLDRRVALKLLHPTVADSPEAQARLQREAWAMARLSHPNVLAVFDVGTVGDQVFVAMELVEGATLRQWLASSPRPMAEVLALFLQAGRGLAAAHAAGLVHRDFKPDNVLVDVTGRARVTDFGLARPLLPPDAPLPEGGDVGAPDSWELTRSGAFVGTPAYMAPEQVRREATDARTDQFGFCVALYEALYGERPFSGENAAALAFNVTLGKVRPPPRDAQVPQWLLTVLLRGLRVAPADRFASMEELLSALESDPARGRKRFQVVTAVGLALLGAAGVGFLLPHRATPRCTAGVERLSGVWDSERRAAVQAGLRSTGSPSADQAFHESARVLDAYAAEWTAQHRDACEATWVRGEQPEAMLGLRMRCLERRLGDLRSLTTLFAAGGKGLAESAVQASQGLTPLAQCRDLDALATGAALPLSPERQSQVAALEVRLGDAKVQRDTGRYAPGLELARPAVAQARELAHPPLLAEALFLLGDLEGRAGAPPVAERLLYEALQQAELGGADRLRAEIATELVWYVGHRQNRREEGHRLASQAAAVIGRLGPGHEALRARLYNFEGVVLRGEGRLAEAQTAHEAALALRQRALPPGHPDIANSLNNLGLVAWQQGRLEEALLAHQRALALRLERLGAEHPDVAMSLNNLAPVLGELGRHEEALSVVEQGLALRRRVLGPGHPQVASALNNRAEQLLALGRPEEAIGEIRAALALKVDPGGGFGPVAHTTLCDALLQAGQIEEGCAEAEAAWGALTNLGPSHPQVGIVQGRRAECRRRRGDLVEAIGLFQDAIARVEQLPGLQPERVGLLVGLGEVFARLHREREAWLTLEQAVAACARHPGPPEVCGDARLALARTLRAQDPERAHSLLAAARADYTRTDHPAPAELTLEER